MALQRFEPLMGDSGYDSGLTVEQATVTDVAGTEHWQIRIHASHATIMLTRQEMLSLLAWIEAFL